MPAPPSGHRQIAFDSIGPTLVGLRQARGLSQLRLAELLCASAGTPTVTRHEVSRWEREERVPGQYWLGWLAAVLETPVPTLEAAARATVRRPANRRPEAHQLWQAPTAAGLLSTLENPVATVTTLAHTWLTGPVQAEPCPPPMASAGGTDGLQALRLTDDLVGGHDLAGRVHQQLHAQITRAGARPNRHGLQLVAGWGQLAGWVHADAGDSRRAAGAYQAGLHAAAAAGDQALAAHVLGSLSHLQLATGQVSAALLLARTAQTGAGRDAPALLRTLLLHRVALAAARAGEQRMSHSALAAADRVGQRTHRGRQPSWLYWLDESELTAMTGRCLVALGRPLRAVPLLSAPRPHTGPRTAALDAIWLARAYLDLGEPERACQIAAGAWCDAVRAGSARVAALLHDLHRRLQRFGDTALVRDYQQVATAAMAYLPSVLLPPRQWAAGR